MSLLRHGERGFLPSNDSPERPDPARNPGLHAHIEHLQATAGNQAVTAWLGAGATGVQRLPDAPRSSGHGGRLLQTGSRGPAVRALQRRLGVAADGIFGAQTRAAVLRVQQRSGISADGIVGPATRAALSDSPTRRRGGTSRSGEATAAAITERLGAISARLRELAAEAELSPAGDEVTEPSEAPVVDESMARDDWLDDAGDWWDETTESAEEAWDETTDYVEDTVDDVADAAGEVWDETTDFIDDTVDDVTDAAGDVWDETTDFIDDTVDDVTDAAGDVWDEVTDTAGDVVDAVSDTAGQVWDETSDFIDETVEGVTDFAEDTLDALGEVASDTLDVLGEVADSVRDLIDDPLDALGDIVDDLLGGGVPADILGRLEQVWNSLWGGDDDTAEADGSGDLANVGPTTVPHPCPRGDDQAVGPPSRLRVELDWGPPSVDGPTRLAAQGGSGRDDTVQASVAYRGFISQTLPAANIPGFGREEPTLTVENIHWDQSDGVIEVRAYAKLECRWGINAHGRIDVPDAEVPAIDDITWTHIIDDLTPGGDDKPPRVMYWASDATAAHEYYHAIDDYGAGERMVNDGDAVSTVNNRRIVDPEAELPGVMQEIHARIYSYLQDHYRSGGESRAYSATASHYHDRIAAIRARAEREGWT